MIINLKPQVNFKEKEYIQNEKSETIKLILGYLISSIIAITLAYIYNTFIVYIPFVYANIFITLFFGVFLGYIPILISKLLHIITNKEKLYLTIFTAFIGFSFQWIAFLTFVYNNSLPSFLEYISNFILFLSPLKVLNDILLINELGTWGLFNVPIKGFILFAIWIIEAIIIFLIPIVLSIKNSLPPYSKNLRKWYKKHILYSDFEYILMKNEFAKKIENNPISAINELELGDGLRFSKISIYFLKGESKQYLSIDNVRFEKRGKGSKNTIPLIRYFEISKNDALNILENFRNKTDFILNY